MSNIIKINKTDYTTNGQTHLQNIRNIIDGYYPHIPEGTYDCTLANWYTVNICGVPKVILLFSILDYGEHFETIIPRFYAIKRFKGKTGLKGAFVSKARGAFAEDYYTMYPDAPRLRPDRVPMTKLQGKIFTVSVGDVLTNNKQKEHIEKMKYSVVRKIELN